MLNIIIRRIPLFLYFRGRTLNIKKNRRLTAVAVAQLF